MKHSPPVKVPKISNKDLYLLYEYAQKLAVIAKKYNLKTISTLYINAYNQIRKK